MGKIDAALEVGVDCIILDGRGGGTGAAPTIVRDHISVPYSEAAGHRHLREFCVDDLTTFKADMADLAGVAYGGVARR